MLDVVSVPAVALVSDIVPGITTDIHVPLGLAAGRVSALSLPSRVSTNDIDKLEREFNIGSSR